MNLPSIRLEGWPTQLAASDCSFVEAAKIILVRGLLLSDNVREWYATYSWNTGEVFVE